MVKIGNKEIIFSQVIGIFNNQDVIIDATTSIGIVRLNISFVEEKEKPSQMRWWSEDEKLQIELKGWERFGSMGTMSDPALLGNSNGIDVWFSVAQLYYSEKKRVVLFEISKQV